MGNRKVLFGLTTTRGSNWREKVEEIKRNGIEEVALFLTGLKKREREELYKLLEKTSIKSIPHVHLRTDMNLSELDYLNDKYKVAAFNLHPQTVYPIIYDYSKYFNKIYMENISKDIPTKGEMEKFAGICVDFAHWEANRKKNIYREFKNMVSSCKIGCCHISAIRNFLGLFTYDDHRMKKINELSYIEKYVDYLP